MPIEIIYTVYDRKGKRTTTSARVGESETLARVNLFATAWADAIDNLIGGVIRSAVALLRANPSGLVGNTVGPNSDVEEIGAFQVNCELGPPVEITIPGLNEDVVDNDTGNIDQTDTDVATLIAMLEDGFETTGDTLYVVNTGDNRANDLFYARERSRNSGKRKVV